jgi:predicted ATPase
VARLGKDLEMLLTAAAVIGQEWDLAIVECVLGWDDSRLQEALRTALGSHIVVPSRHVRETYRFTHSLWREVLYGQLMLWQRKQLHQQVANALEQQIAHTNDEAMQAVLASQFLAAEG